MDISVKALEEAVSIRRQIDSLEKRLSTILSGAPARPAIAVGPRHVSAATRAKLAAATRARWARIKAGKKKAAPKKKKGGLTPAGRRKLSQLMKARWAARRKAAGTRTTSTRKRGALTPAGRKRLSELMKARWATRRKAASK
jgi:Spy/CpxP family protein refolding chaperone